MEKEIYAYSLLLSLSLQRYIQSHSTSAALKTAVLSPFRALCFYLEIKRLLMAPTRTKPGKAGAQTI